MSPNSPAPVFSYVWYNLGQHVVKKWGLSGSRHQEFQPSEPSRTGRNEALPCSQAPLHHEPPDAGTHQKPKEFRLLKEHQFDMMKVKNIPKGKILIVRGIDTSQ
ncbi:hypothetical protein E5288_WYG016458 [Bos mutus]|uniref:Uncharacterized protein n=1 Tax=Bos mutus TaxID=72004 RepID=A0A6B0RAA1_9CETA|nr:hypothetical protein [Bos mutus]